MVELIKFIKLGKYDTGNYFRVYLLGSIKNPNLSTARVTNTVLTLFWAVNNLSFSKQFSTQSNPYCRSLSQRTIYTPVSLASPNLVSPSSTWCRPNSAPTPKRCYESSIVIISFDFS